MRLTVLGGSAAIPNAGAGCAGFLVEEGDTRVVIDLGPGTLGELRRHVDLAAVDAVVISHMHVDHVLDVIALRHGLAFMPEPAPEPLTVWLPPGGEALLRAILAPLEAWESEGTFDLRVTLREYAPAEPLSIGSIMLSFRPTVHDIPCWAIRVDGPTSSTVYGADGGPTSDLANFAREADLLIAEATLTSGDDDPDRGSLTAVEAGEFATRSDARRLLLTHIWQEHDFEAQRGAAVTSYDGPISVAHPGLVLEV